MESSPKEERGEENVRGRWVSVIRLS